MVILALVLGGYFLLQQKVHSVDNTNASSSESIQGLLLNDQVKKIVYKYYDKDQMQTLYSKIYFLNSPGVGSFDLKNPWVVPSSMEINGDATLTYIEDIAPYSKPVQRSLVRVNPLDNSALQKIGVFNPENAGRIGELDKRTYFLTDRDKGTIYSIDPTTFTQKTITLPSPISSSYWTPDVQSILYTKNEKPTGKNTNIYAFDIGDGTEKKFLNQKNEPISIQFSPYSTYDTDTPICQFDESRYSQQYWWNGSKYFSPDNNQLAIDNCGKGIVVLNLQTYTVNQLYKNERAYLLGWLDNQTILARVENKIGDYRIIRVTTASGQERPIVPEDYYWDIFWRIAPDKTKIVYAASSINFTDFQAHNIFATAGNSPKADIYLLDLRNNTREQLFANYPLEPLGGNIDAVWSANSTNILLQGFNPDSGQRKCDIYSLQTKNTQTIEPCMNAAWVE